MAKMPEEGRFEYGKMDKNTGAQWVHVTPEMARAHPQGRLNALLWVIVAAFAALGAIKVYLSLTYGGTGLLVGGVVELLTALMLAIRAPWGVWLAGAQLLVSVFGLVTGGVLKELALTETEIGLAILAYFVFLVLALFYLVEGERPNLIYRHRFRSYRRANKE